MGDAPNPTATLKFTGPDTLQVVNMMHKDGPLVLTGKKQITYPDYYSKRDLNLGSVSGVYEGSYIDQQGRKSSLVLTVVPFGGYSMGRLKLSHTNLDLQIGTRTNEGIVYLTKGKQNARPWFHIRGHLVPGSGGTRLVATMIVAGQGRTKKGG